MPSVPRSIDYRQLSAGQDQNSPLTSLPAFLFVTMERNEHNQAVADAAATAAQEKIFLRQGVCRAQDNNDKSSVRIALNKNRITKRNHSLSFVAGLGPF